MAARVFRVQDTGVGKTYAVPASASTIESLGGMALSAASIQNTNPSFSYTLSNLTAENVNNLGGRISGNAVNVAANNDLNNIGGTVDAANNLTAIAGRDLNVTTRTPGFN